MGERNLEYKQYYADQLESARQFQDFCSNIFIQNMGIAITNYQSKQYQYDKGENMQGIEIKYDKKFRGTGNIYIETAEKSNPNNSQYVKSGIFRLDNSWLYIIGDYDGFYLFDKKYLQRIFKSNKYRTVQIPTSQGFLIPVSDADVYCIKYINTSNLKAS